VLLLHVHLTFSDLTIRPHHIIPIPYRLLSKWLVGDGLVYEEFALAFVPPPPIVCGSFVISNYLPMLINNSFEGCGIPRVCGPRVPALAVVVEVSYEHLAASPLPDYLLPVQSPRWTLSCLTCPSIVNDYNSHPLLSSFFDVSNNYIILCILAQVGLFVCCKTAFCAHCHSHLLSVANVVCRVADSDSCLFSWWLLQTNYNSLPFHPRLEFGHVLYIRPRTVMLDRFKYCEEQLAFHF